MGAVDLGAGGGRRAKGGSGVKKPKRVGFVLDMTPLVDIAFLLLTFFMFATTMTQPQMMEMRIPPDIDTPVEVSDSILTGIYVAEKGNIYYRNGVDTTFHEIKLEDLRDFSVKRNSQMGNSLVLTLRMHPEASYENMVEVLDELNKAEAILVRQYPIEKKMERKRKFAIQRLDSLEQYRLEQL